MKILNISLLDRSPFVTSVTLTFVPKVMATSGSLDVITVYQIW